jgi:hypothetical protein
MTYKKGDVVWVLTLSAQNTLVVEGQATVMKVLANQDFYRVMFHRGGDVHDRFIDPEAQGDPHAYVERINAQWAKSRQ